jgi:murein DD-endopeptidase MepM/ murein hydrolase activator NlpD
LARHRSPSGAHGDDLECTTQLHVVAIPGVHRLPPPPSATMHGRAMMVAVAGGAFVAAGQTLAAPFIPAEAPTTISALLPVAVVTNTGTDADAGTATDQPDGRITAIGSDQLLPDTLAVGGLDPQDEVDVKNLAKAADIGQELARQAGLVNAALADGASEAHLFGGHVFVRPAIGTFTSGFGSRWGVTHYGIDIANKIGTPIYALTDGVVEDAGPATGFGLWVVLRHPDGSHSVYGHVNRMFVKVGDKVKAGDQIAEIGNRGESTGPHLHLEIWDPSGTKVNPVPWLAKHGIIF